MPQGMPTLSTVVSITAHHYLLHQLLGYDGLCTAHIYQRIHLLLIHPHSHSRKLCLQTHGGIIGAHESLYLFSHCAVLGNVPTFSTLPTGYQLPLLTHLHWMVTSTLVAHHFPSLHHRLLCLLPRCHHHYLILFRHQHLCLLQNSVQQLSLDLHSHLQLI